jgi:hypothetical protein
MYVQLANNSHYYVKVEVRSQTGIGYYEIPPHYWMPSGFWTPYKKFILAFDYYSGEPLSCQIIWPQPNRLYRIFPQIGPIGPGMPAPAMPGEEAAPAPEPGGGAYNG